MYRELGSVQGIVDLSPQEVLDRVERFLERQGYRTTQRTHTSLFVERSRSDQCSFETGNLYLTGSASVEPGGGVRVTIQGNDHEGVNDRQAEWIEWVEGLPNVRTAEGHIQPQAHPGSPSEAPGEGTEDISIGEHKEEGSTAPSQRHEGDPAERVTQESSQEIAGRGGDSDQVSKAWSSVAPWGGTVRAAPGG